MSSFAEQVPVPLPPSFFELETSDSESDADLQSFGRAFEGLVIAVSGKLPGETHYDIQHMVEKLGATYEKFDVSKCTHLITAPSTPRLRKEARESEGCKVVIVEWLYESQAKKEPLGPEDFLVEFDQQNLNRTPAISKRKFEAERDYLAGSWKKPEDRPKVSLETLAGLLDPEYPSDKIDLTVWIDHENEIWDATLLKPGLLARPSSSTPLVTGAPTYVGQRYAVQSHQYDIGLCRLQIVFNEKTKQHFMRLRLRPSHLGEDTRVMQVGDGSLEFAKRRFQAEFASYTGLDWGRRHLAPKEDKYLFVPCQVDDNRALTPVSINDDQDQPSPHPQVRDILNLIFDSKMPPTRTWKLEKNVTEYTLRVGNALLDQICKLRTETRGVFNKNERLVLKKILASVQQCYCALMFTTWEPSKMNNAKVKGERTFLERLLKDPSARNPENLMLQSARLNLAKLKLANIAPVDPASKEYAALADYFNKTSTNPIKIIGIMHIERPGEAKRMEKWCQDHRDKAGHRRLLWHGSPTTNFVGILSKGLRMHARPGAAFGIYHADMSTMSQSYCRVTNGDAFMLLNEVELGYQLVNTGQLGGPSYYGFDLAQSAAPIRASFISGTTRQLEWRDSSHVHPDLKGTQIPDFRHTSSIANFASMMESYNQYVVYDDAQVRQRYLFHIEFP